MLDLHNAKFTINIKLSHIIFSAVLAMLSINLSINQSNQSILFFTVEPHSVGLMT